MKRIIALLLVISTCLSLCACGKSEPATACEKLIEQIGEVTLDSEQAIVAAENAFAALADAQKAEISQAEQTLKTAREKYDALLAEKEEADRLAKEEAEKKAQVEETIALINAIGEVTMDSKQAISAARTKYDALDSEQKAQVTNVGALTAAENAFQVLNAANKEKLLKQYKSKFKVTEDKVERLTWYEPKGMPKYIDTRCYIIPYIGVKNNNVWICIRYNYTADEWVFWKSLKIVVDGENYSKYVGAFGTVRDNDTEVWEYYDEALNYNQSMDSEQLVMLRKIAESKETIIRFQGDDYHHDLVVKQKDKDMIKDVLALYEALLP